MPDTRLAAWLARLLPESTGRDLFAPALADLAIDHLQHRTTSWHYRRQIVWMWCGCVRLALIEDSTGPSLVAAQNRRGLVVLVAARPLDRPPRGLGRTPGGCILVIPGGLPNRRPVLEVAGCQGFLTTRTGAAAAMEAVAG